MDLLKVFDSIPHDLIIAKMYIFYLGFLSQTFTINRAAGKGGSIYLTPLYHFHPLHRHIDISQMTTAESPPLHIASSWTQMAEPLVSECKLLATKLCTLKGRIKIKELTRLIMYSKYFYLAFCKSQYLVHFFSIYL